MYEFVGFFTIERPQLRDAVASRWPTAAVATISEPFRGMGVRFSDTLPATTEDEARLNQAFRDALADTSTAFPDHPFVYIEAECWGGTCQYRGRVFRGGEILSEESGPGALRRLITNLGAKLDAREFFSPFTREFPWERAA